MTVWCSMHGLIRADGCPACIDAADIARGYLHPDYNDEERQRHIDREGDLNDQAEARRHR